MSHHFKLTEERKLVKLEGIDFLRPLISQQIANAIRTENAAAGAEDARDEAVDARDEAGQARDLALAASLTAPKVFASETEGRAGVGDSDTFWVDGGGYGLLLYRRSNAGASTLLGGLPTAARLALGDGSALVGFNNRGNDAVVQDLREAVREIRLGSVSDYGAKWDGVSNTNAAFMAAFNYLSSTRAYDYYLPGDPGVKYKGLGAIRLAKGNLKYTSISFGQTNQIGLDIGGDAVFASTMDMTLGDGENAFNFRNYGSLHLHDTTIRYTGASQDTAAIDLDSTGGGNLLTLKRVTIEGGGFDTAIRLNGDTVNGVAVPGDGDKTLVEQVVMTARKGFDQSRNNQAYGWTFLNCTSGCEIADFLLGGAGETLIINHVGNPFGAFIKFPERTGNGGKAQSPARGPGGAYVPGNYPNNRVTVENTKLEYHEEGTRLLVDGRESLLRADQGGSTVDLTLRGVSIASGSNWPVPGEHVVIEIGDDQQGSDGFRIHQDGGWIEGIVKVGSNSSGAVNLRWSFRDAVKAPDPKLLQLLGGGSHYLMEWRANDNVPVDQYRGGQAFTGSIDAEKVYLWGHLGPRLVNTAGGLGADAQIGDRFGGQFTLTDFSPGATIKGMAVQLEKSPGTDTVVEWFATGGGGTWNDATNTLIGSATIAAGTPAGKIVSIADLAMANWHLLTSGNIFVRITKPGQAQETFGRLLVFYFPRIPLVA